MSETKLELQIVASSKDAIAALDNLCSALERVKKAVTTGFANISTKSISNFGKAINGAVTQATVERYERLAKALEKVGQAAAKLPNVKRIKEAVDEATPSAIPRQSGTERIGGSVEQPIAEVAPTAREAAEATKMLGERFKELFNITNRGKRHIGGIIGQFMRVARLRFIRAVLKQISDGFKFGFDNMYQYAKAVGHSFAPAVDSAQNALFKMKNSIGAALAPAIQMLIPYLVQAVNWFINLVNAVNQFLSLLRGQSTWTRATNAPATTLDKVKNSANGASAAVKELKGMLADWDELNIIQQESGGGGGSGSGSNADDMSAQYGLLFEEVSTFNGKVQEIAEKVKRIGAIAREAFGWIQESFSSVSVIAEKISETLQSWGVSKELSRVLGRLMALVILPAKIVFDVTAQFDKKFLETKDEGYLLGSMLTGALGAFVAGKLMKSLTGSTHLGFLAASVPLIISATADFIAIMGNTNSDALSKENIELGITESLKTGAAAFMISKALGGEDATLAGTLTDAAGASLLTFGATVGVKAVKGMMDTGEITADNIIGSIGGLITESTGIAMLAKKNLNLGWKKALGTGIALGLLTLSAPVGVKAVKGWVETGEITWESIADFLPTALSFGASVAALTNDVTGNWQKATGAGIAAGALAITVPLAVKAVKDVIDAKEITWKSISDFMPTAVGFGTSVFGILKSTGMNTWQSGKVAIGGGLVALTIPLAIKAVKNVIDGSDITWDSIVDFIPTAVGFGSAVASAAGAFTDSKWAAARTGIGAGIIALGVPLAIKTYRDVVDTNEITLESLQTYVEGAIPFAVGAGTMTGSWQAGAAVGALSILVPIGVKAFRGYMDTSALSKDRIKMALTFALSSIGSGLMLSSTMEKMGLLQSGGGKAGAVGSAFLSMGALIGVKAYRDAVDAGGLTKTSIVEGIISALSAGIGTTMFALAAGASLSTAALIGGGVVLATGLIIGLAIKFALEKSEDKDAIVWGNKNATETEIQTFVTNNLFSANAKVALSLVNTTVTATEEEKKKVEEAAKSLFVTLNVLKLGVDTSSSLINAVSQFNTWVSTIKTYARTQITELETGVTLSPILSETGEDLSGKFLTDTIVGWDMITGGMEALGKELSDALIDSATGEMKKDWDKDLVQTILQKINTVNQTVLTGQMVSGATSSLQMGLLGLDNTKWSKKSVDKALQLYEDYQKQLWEGYITIFQREAEGKEYEASYLRGLAAQENDPELKAKYETQAKLLEDEALYMRGQIEARVERAMTENTGQGKNFLVKWFKQFLDEDAIKEYFEDIPELFKELYEYNIQKGMSQTDALNDAMENLMSGNIKMKEISEYAKRLGVSVAGLLGEEFQSEFIKMMYEDIPTEALETDIPEVEYELEVDLSGAEDLTVPAADMSQLTESVSQAAESVQESVEQIRGSFRNLDGLSFSFSGNSYGGSYTVHVPTMMKYAEGGFVTTGEMFIARESGPEMVGTIGNRTAVANNNQIVAGIAGGVASGQAEQNALLRQQNDLLRRILAKESTVRLEPSAMLGKVTRRSEEMYAKNTGR